MKRSLKKVDYSMLRGLEISIKNTDAFRMRGDGKVVDARQDPMDAEVEFRYHHFTDLLFFEVYPPYAKHLVAFMGVWRLLYVHVPDPMRANFAFYLAPVGATIRLANFLRRIWMTPARWAYESGHLKAVPGEQVPLFWPVRLRLRRQAHLGR